MMFIRVRQFVAFVAFAFACIGGGAVAGYLLFTDEGWKLAAERFLFFGIVASLVMLIVGVRILMTAGRMQSKMDKLLELVRQGGTLPLDRLSIFGKFGKKMQGMYGEITSVSERKTSRIILQNVLLDRIMELVEVPLLLVDATGDIRMASGGFLERHRLSQGELVGSALLDQVADLDFHTILTETGRTKGPVELEKDKQKLTFYPIFSTQNAVAYLIVVFGEHELLTYHKEQEPAEPAKSPARPKKGAFSRFFRLFIGDKKKK